MKRGSSILLALVCSGAAVLLQAQVPGSASDAARQQPEKSQTAPKPSGANPFPEDTSSVPVIPTTAPSPQPSAGNTPDRPLRMPPVHMPPVRMPDDNSDPVRSPDQMPSVTAGGGSSNSSSSLQGLGSLLEPPPDEGKNHHHAIEQPAHPESAEEDISVGSYYLQTRNWRGALSRYQSALVLAPENPDVYWGLAECQRHLGQFAAAKANYLKVLEYDPDSKRSKEARRLLTQPELANVPAVSSNQPAGKRQQ